MILWCDLIIQNIRYNNKPTWNDNVSSSFEVEHGTKLSETIEVFCIMFPRFVAILFHFLQQKAIKLNQWHAWILRQEWMHVHLFGFI